MKFIILLIGVFFFLNASANYCVEAFSYDNSKQIPQDISKKIYTIIDNFDKARVEKRGENNLLRVGDFKSKAAAKKLLEKIKVYFNEAKIRRCVYDKEAVIFESKIKKETNAFSENSIKQVRYIFSESQNKNKNGINTKVDIDKNVIYDKYEKDDDIEKIISDTKKYENKMDKYNSNSFLKGLYLKGEYETSKKKNNKYALELEYELFNDGFYEAKKRGKKYLLDTQIEIYNTLNSLKNQSIEQKRDYLTIVKNTINYYYYKNLKVAYEVLYKEKRIKLENSEITMLDMKEFESEIKNINLYIELYSKTQQNRIDKRVYDVINKIEDAILIDKDRIVSMVQDSDYRLKMQDNYIDKTKLLDDWWLDNLKVNFYVKHEDSYGSENDFIGAKFEIPLGVDSERDELIKLKQNSHKNQKRVLEIRNRQTVTLLIENFNFLKQEIKILKNELSLLIDKYMIAKLKEVNFADSIKYSKEDDMIDIRILEHKHQIILKRFDLYKTLVNLQILADSNDIIEK